MPSCYVPYCKTGNRYGEGFSVHLFKIPKNSTIETKKNWLRNIPKRKGEHFEFSKHRICHLHFQDEYIVKAKQVWMGTELVSEEPRMIWTLKSDAVPTMFSNKMIPKYFDKKVYTRKPPKQRPFSSVAQHNEVAVPHPMPEIEIDTTEPTDLIEISPIMVCNFEELCLMKLPESWMFQRRDTSMRFIEMSEDTRKTVPIYVACKTVEIFKDFNFTVQVRSKDITNRFEKIQSTDEIHKLIISLSDMKLCTGVKNLNMFTLWPSATKIHNIWFSNDCSEMSATDMCDPCSNLKIEMRKAADEEIRSTSASRKITRTNLRLLRKRRAADKLRIWRMQRRNIELKQMYLKLKNTDEQKLEDAINVLSLPPPMKSAVLTSVKFAKAKSKYGMRYQADWILQALLLKITSPKGYRKLRESKILPLPHPSHLTSLLRGIPCQFGFSEYVLAELHKAYSGKPKRDCQVIVMIDEMGCQEGITFEKMTMKLKGYIDYAEFSSDVKESKSSKREADHCLVFALRFMNSKVTQPVAVFATRGAAPGNVLVKMIIECITRVEDIGLEVIGVVNDGAATNKAAWRELGIGVTNGKIVNSIQNPVDENRRVHFICDMPHVVKCIRNHLHNKEVGMFSGETVNWAFYKALYDVDRRNDLRVVPKLTPRHVNPGPFQKMRVSYAVQVFSKSVATGLKTYREIAGNSLFRNSESTEKFTLLINDLFDACNGRAPSEGVRPNDEKFKTIQDFLAAISPNDSFASAQTLISLQITLASTLDLIVYLCDGCGYEYALPGKFNQDPLEKFFGLARSSCGNDTHPTVSSFSQIFRLLSVYFPTSRSIKGNIREHEEYSIVSASSLETLKTLKASAKSQKEKISQDFENKIITKLLCGEELEEQNSLLLNISSDHSYFRPPIERCITYSFCGFLAYKGKTFTNCEACVETLIDRNPVNADSQLTCLKDFGGLKYPSQALFNLVYNKLEPVLQTSLSSINTTADIVESFIDNLEEVNYYGIGCSQQHSLQLVVRIIQYFVTVRLWFYARIHNKEVLRGSTKKQNRMKLAKL